MLKELHGFAAETKKRKLLAENDLLAADITLRLIQNSEGKTWKKLVDFPWTCDTFLCRADKILENYVYFAVEGSMSLSWRVIGTETDVFSYYFSDEIEILA